MKQEIPWNRFAVEAIVIVGSILLAFAIEAWWDELNNRNEEIVVLQALLDDLETKRNFLSGNRQYNALIAASAESLLSASVGDSDLTGEEIDEAINLVSFTNQAGWWISAPLNSLMNGGNISIITNPELIQQLAALQANFSRVEIFSRNDNDFYSNHLMPFLRKNANLLQFASLSANLPGSDIELSFPEIGLTTKKDYSELLQNEMFRNLLVERIYSIQDITDIGYRSLEPRLNRTIEIISNEL